MDVQSLSGTGWASIEWDAGNAEKCLRHGVSRAEIEDVFSRPIKVFEDPLHSIAETRHQSLFGADRSTEQALDHCLSEHLYRIMDVHGPMML